MNERRNPTNPDTREDPGIERRVIPTPEQRIAALEAEVLAIKDDLKANTESTNRVEANTKEMLEFFNSVKGAFRVLDMLGKLAKPLTYILMLVGAITAFWLTLKNGGKVHE